MNGNLNCFLPNSALTLIKEEKEFFLSEGTILFADVAGFTPLTEALMVLGKEGSEELTRILNNYFSEMIDIVYEYNGDILRFAGDAMTIFFESDKGETAISCGLKMLKTMNKFEKVDTRAGQFKLEMKVGCAFGKVQIGILNDGTEVDYYALGEPLDLCAEAEHHAKRGEIVAEKNVSINSSFLKTAVKENFFKVVGVPIEPISCSTNYQKEDLSDVLVKIVPKHIIEKAETQSVGEHRGTSVLFLSFSLKKAKEDEIHRQICDFYIQLKKIVQKYGGIINKFDFGDKGAKALILFGTPYSIENREIMSLRCAIEIKDALGEKWHTRIGITSSHLFSATIGSQKRKEFTVMGDGINLAARLMTYCVKENIPIIVDEKSFNSSKNEINFSEKGAIEVKGKSGLIPIFEPTSIVEEELKREEKKLYGFEKIQNSLVEWIKSDERNPILITSEIGGGKTSLANYLYHQCLLREYRCIKIDLQIFSKELFFSLFSRFFKNVLQIKNKEDIDNLSHLLDENLKQFIKLLYSYFNFEEDSNSFKNLSPKEKRDIAFSILLSLLQKKERYILIIDNLSFADVASLDFLSHILNQFGKKALDVVAFSRKEILDSQISNIFQIKIELKPFDKENIKKYFEVELGVKNLTEKVVDFFLNKSKGNPQLLLSLFDAALKEGIVIEKENAKFIDEDRLFKTTFPDSLEAIYLKEFDKLSGQEKQFLFSASVFGMNVSVNLLQEITGYTDDYISSIFTELEKKHFLRIDNSGKRKYLQFTDTLLYEAIYNLAPFEQKRTLHKKIFDAILKFEGESKSSTFPYLAYHSERGDDTENAVKFHRLSGRYFIERFDNVSALRHLEYVVKNDKTSSEFFKDGFSLLNLYLDLGKFDESKQLLEKLWLFENSLTPVEISRLLNLQSIIDIRKGKIQLADINLNRALRIAEDADEREELARALLNLVGMVYGPLGRYEEGIKTLEKLLYLPRFEGDAVFRVVALMNLGLIYRHLENYEFAYIYYKKSLSLAKKEKLVPRESAIVSNLVGLTYHNSDFKKSIYYAKRGVELSKTFSQRDVFIDISYNLGLSLWAFGKIKEAIKVSSEAVEMAKYLNRKYGIAMAKTTLSVSLFEELYFLESLENILKSIDILEEFSTPAELLSSKLEFLRLLEFLGDEKTFDEYLKKWGGKEKILEESKSLSLPISLISIIEKSEFEKDLDAQFIFWLKKKDKESLLQLKKDIKEKTFRYDLKVKWCWAFLSKDLKPPFNPLKLLSKSKGGIYGLKILAILFRKFLTKGNKAEAKRIRNRFLFNLYFAKVHSDEKIWESIIKDKDIRFAILGKK